MNDRARQLRSNLLRRYYKSAVLGWERPRSFHWAKVVDDRGHWRWTRADMGIRGRLLRNPPIHLYQTVNRFRTEGPPRGYLTKGYFLGGPLFFDLDIGDKWTPLSIWQLKESAYKIQELAELLADHGDYQIKRVTFSGFRGVHVVFDSGKIESPLELGSHAHRFPAFKDRQRRRMMLARSVGNWCLGWDWKVSADLWRVSRVPLSLHGASALEAIPISPPYTPKDFGEQLTKSSPFTFSTNLRIRTTRPVPLFTFIDHETYGPYRKGWATKLPIAVALHLIWLGLAKPREAGPKTAGRWFERGWQMLFQRGVQEWSKQCLQSKRSAA
ncbi:MAG: hypothetical protein ACFFER_03510 [Candidatus Thorarchaeota archaeon]